jgi:hypothetical protein
LLKEAEMLGLWRVAVTLVILPIAAATAAEPLDGAYAGQSSLLRGGPPTCPVPGKVSWTITDSHFTPNWYKSTIPPKSQPTARSRQRHVHLRQQDIDRGHNGVYREGALEADIESTGCKYHYSLKKI